MNIDMTKSHESATSNDDGAVSYRDESDTVSFDIDELDEDENTIRSDVLSPDNSTADAVTPTLVNFANTTVNNTSPTNNPAAVLNRPSAAKLSDQTSSRYVRSLLSADDESESKSHIAVPIPTTTTVVAATLGTAQQCVQKIRLLTPLQHSKVEQLNIESNTTSVSEDNLSCSIATTTTEIDPENIPSASPEKHPTAQKEPNDEIDQYSLFTDNDLAITRNVNAVSGSSQPDRTESGEDIPPLTAIPATVSYYKWTHWLGINSKSSGIGEPSVYHALVVIFLEFFAWGLLTMPIITLLNQTFPDHTFLMNGLVMGIKGILSFLSAPLIGALSDIWGRKFFLLITVFFTCAPIPLMAINAWWFFAMISMSGIFAVTFSVVFAYVADVTTVEERSRAYGLASATFAASLVISPALGAVLRELYSDTLVIALATAIAVLDVFFILVAVPESLAVKIRPSSWTAPISWEQADPFSALRKVGSDHTVLMQCVTVFFSYLPEAGQYSCIFVYLKLKMGFQAMEVAIFIAVVGTLSIAVQVTLGGLMRVLGAKTTIILGLILEMLQLLWFGFGSQAWMMWAAGILAALASITYPAISAFVSIHSNADSQGAVQGMVTGMRGLCNGLGPAMFGVIFYLFHVDLNDEKPHLPASPGDHNQTNVSPNKYSQLVEGPPFVFGAFMVILAILVAIYIPKSPSDVSSSKAPSEKKRVSLDVPYEVEYGPKSSPLSPLMRSDSLAQL